MSNGVWRFRDMETVELLHERGRALRAYEAARSNYDEATEDGDYDRMLRCASTMDTALAESREIAYLIASRARIDRGRRT